MADEITEVEYNARILNSATLHVYLKPSLRFKLRIKVSIFLIRIAAWIAGFKGIEVDERELDNG